MPRQLGLKKTFKILFLNMCIYKTPSESVFQVYSISDENFYKLIIVQENIGIYTSSSFWLLQK